MPKIEKRTFVYQQRSKDDLRDRANMRSGGFDDWAKSSYKKYKVRDGKNIIRILPPTWQNAKHYGYDIWLNYNIGPDNQSYLSLKKMKNEKDPIAEAQQQAAREGDEKLARELSPRQRILMWVIDRQAEEEGPMLWAAPFSLDKDLANVSFDEDTGEIVYIDDPDSGWDVRFYKEGTGLATKYPGAKIRLLKESPISQDEKQLNAWLEYIQENPLPDCLQYYDYAHIAGVFDGQVNPRSGHEDEEEDAPSPKPKAVPQRGTPPWDDEDDPKSDEVKTKVDVEETSSARNQNGTRKPRPQINADEDEAPPAGSIRDRIRQRRLQVVGDDE